MRIMGRSKTFEKSFAKIAPNGRGLLGLCPKNPLLGSVPRACVLPDGR